MAYDIKKIIEEKKFLSIFFQKSNILSSKIDNAMTILEGSRLTKGEKPYNTNINVPKPK